jgi:hypothetical protein
MQGFGFLWSRRPVEGHFSTTHSDRIYTYLYKKTVLYGVYVRRLKFTYGVNEYGYGEILFIHTYIYVPYIYGVYIHIRFGPTLPIRYNTLLIRNTRIIRKRIYAILGGILGLHQPPSNHHELSPQPPEHYNASW